MIRWPSTTKGGNDYSWREDPRHLPRYTDGLVHDHLLLQPCGQVENQAFPSFQASAFPRPADLLGKTVSPCRGSASVSRTQPIRTRFKTQGSSMLYPVCARRRRESARRRRCVAQACVGQTSCDRAWKPESHTEHSFPRGGPQPRASPAAWLEGACLSAGGNPGQVPPGGTIWTQEAEIRDKAAAHCRH